MSRMTRAGLFSEKMKIPNANPEYGAPGSTQIHYSRYMVKTNMPNVRASTGAIGAALLFPSASGMSRALPTEDLLKQFLTDPSGQWTRAQ